MKITSVIIAALAAVSPVLAAEADNTILFKADFEKSSANAVFAKGNPAAAVSKPAEFVKDGVSGEAVRLKPGIRLTFEQKNNVDLNAGTAIFWVRPVDWNPAKPTAGCNWFFGICGIGADGGRIQVFKHTTPTLMAFVGNKGAMKSLTQGMGYWKQNQWYMIAVTWNEGRTVLYVNGKLVARSNITKAELPKNTGEVFSLQSSFGTTDFDNVVIYNRALSMDEMKKLYAKTAPVKK